MGDDGCNEPCQVRQVVGATPSEVATQLGLVLDQHHRCSRIGRTQCGRHPRRSATRDKDVGMGIALVVGTVRAGLPVDATTGSELPEDLLVQGVPEEPGPHEGLVVEAGGQEPSDQLVDGGEVPTQARPDVLGADGHAVGQPAAAGADVGLVSDLHEQVRIPVVGGQDSAPPVVLHAAGEHLDTRCCQRRGDRVALVACETATVPGE